MPTIHLVIKGKVQGVFFRASAKDKALEEGLAGWVKNTAEGNVELMATGGEQALERFVSWCRQGPPSSKVTEVIFLDQVVEKPFFGFTIVR